ncbi:NUDIX hydrolase [Streptomyces populi]
MVLDPVTSEKITGCRPRKAPPVWPEVAPLVRSVVAATASSVPYGVDRSLHVTGRLALWAETTGLDRDPDVWLRNEVIDALVLSRVGNIEASSVRTYRTWLLRVRDALAWSGRGEAAPARMHADAHPHQPCTAAELAGLRHWAAHLPRQQKTDALALLGLGAGLGFTPKEVAATRGPDLGRPRRGGPLLHTGAKRPVPLVARAAWDAVLGEPAERAGAGFMFRPGRTVEYAKSLVGSRALAHRPPQGLPGVSVGRLRATWIVELMRAHIDHHLIAQATPSRGRAPSSLVPPVGTAQSEGGVSMIDGWSTVSSTVQYTGVRVVVRRDSVRRTDQSLGTYEYTESVDGVRVVALDDQGRIALVEENVYVCGQRLLMCPGGGCEPGEDPQAAARRELAEEAGIRALEVELLTVMWRMPAGARTREHLYLARGLSIGEHHRDESEADMELHRVPLEEAVAMCGDGRITEAGTLAAVLLTAQRTAA